MDIGIMTENINEIDTDKITGEHLIRAAELSLQMEFDRYESLSSLATRLLTSISIVSVALLAALPLLFSSFEAAGKQQAPIMVFFCLVFAGLLASFSLALFSQIRFKYESLSGPKKLAANIIEYGDYPSYKKAAIHFCDSTQICYETTRNRNNKICVLLSCSMISLLITIFLIALFSIVLLGVWAS